MADLQRGVESVAATFPALETATAEIRLSVKEVGDLLKSSPDSTSLSYQFLTKLKEFLIIADTLRRPDMTRAGAPGDLDKLRDSIDQFDGHFAALIAVRETKSKAAIADPSDLKRYEDANAAEATWAGPQLRYVFIGDTATEKWPLASAFPGKPFLNRGIAGQTSSQILSRFIADVVALHPEAAIINAGTADLANGADMRQIADNLVMMGDVARAHSVHPIFTSLLPAAGPGTGNLRVETVKQLNEWILNYCVREKLVFVDYYSSLTGPTGALRPEFTDDGLTPNGAAFAIMTTKLTDGLKRLQDLISVTNASKKTTRK